MSHPVVVMGRNAPGPVDGLNVLKTLKRNTKQLDMCVKALEVLIPASACTDFAIISITGATYDLTSSVITTSWALKCGQLGPAEGRAALNKIVENGRLATDAIYSFVRGVRDSLYDGYADKDISVACENLSVICKKVNECCNNLCSVELL